ncbi:hypothetical protein FOA52_011109 [Chlamydomonas sp. UWO 241]|nr:hypothetical protein FOA52_011109 [Chlamydomonas sp. UWO 241]
MCAINAAHQQHSAALPVAPLQEQRQQQPEKHVAQPCTLAQGASLPADDNAGEAILPQTIGEQLLLRTCIVMSHCRECRADGLRDHELMAQKLRDMRAWQEIVLSQQCLSMAGPTSEALCMAKEVLHKAPASDHGPAWLDVMCALASCYNTLIDWAVGDTDALNALADVVLTPALVSLLRDALAADDTAAPLRQLLCCMDQLALGYTGGVEEPDPSCAEPGATAKAPVQRSLQEIEAAMFATAAAAVSTQQPVQPAAAAGGADHSSPQLAGLGRVFHLYEVEAEQFAAASAAAAAASGTAPQEMAFSLSAGGASAAAPAAAQAVALSLSAGGAPEWVPAAPAPLLVQSQPPKAGACSSLNFGAPAFVPTPKAGAFSLSAGAQLFLPAQAF